MPAWQRWFWCSWSACSLLAMGCSQVLGFEDAELDPLLLGGAGASGDTQEPENLSLCQRFCRTVMDACGSSADGDSLAVYDSNFTCERQCELFDLGTPGDQTGNTLHCRLSNAELALQFPGERMTACPAAGPGGDGVCGDNCEGYCTLMQSECSEFDSRESCLDECRGVPDLGGFDISITEGDSLQCRLYHLNAALVSPQNHCPHAAGAFPCASPEP